MCAMPSYMHPFDCLQAVRIIVFDLDDTLYPERQYVRSGFRAVSTFLQEAGIVKLDVFPSMWSLFVADERASIFNRVLEDCGIAPAQNLIDSLIAVYRSHQPDITLYPDARAVLDYFYKRRMLALLSDGHAQTQTLKLAALNIARYFDTAVLTDELGRDCWKPSPAGFEKIMRTLGGIPAAYVYIADNPLKDFAAPRSLGWHTMCVRRPGGVYSDAAAPTALFEADMQVDDLYQAGQLLDAKFLAH